MGEVICFLSGKGGTGKSALCAGVATALATSGRRVLCIDGDVGLRSLDIYLGIDRQEALSFFDICSGNYPLSAALVHPQFPCLSFLTAPVNCEVGDIDPLELGQMLRQAKSSYDFVLLDGPAGIGGGMRLMAQSSDRCILVALPDPANLRSADRAAQELEKMGVSTKLVVNRVYKEILKAMGKTIDDVMDEVGLPLLGLVPSDMDVGYAAAAGKPLIRYSRAGGAAAAHRRIARRIQGQSVPISMR